MQPIIATRYLKCLNKNKNRLLDLNIKISVPFQVSENEKEFDSEHLYYCCIIYIVDNNGQVTEERVYGTDEVQAIHLASDLESLIKRMSKKLDIFWPTGEGYFEE